MTGLTADLRRLAICAIAAAGLSACMPADKPEMLASRGLARAYVETDAGINLSYAHGGDPNGQRIIFVHGTPGSAGTWLALLDAIPPGLEVIAIDRPGFGETRPNRAVTSLVAQAAVLEPLLDTPGRGKPILVGHSLGGPIVAEAAAMFGDRIAGVVIAAGSLDPSLEKTHPMQYVGAVPPFRWLLASQLRHANAELMALKRELEALAGRLAEITVPVEIVHGTRDDLVPYANVPFMQAKFTAVSDLDIITLEGTDHFLPWNSRSTLWRAILRLHERSAQFQ